MTFIMKKILLNPWRLKATSVIIIAISMLALISCAEDICPAYGYSGTGSDGKYAESRHNTGKIESPYTAEYAAKREKEIKNHLSE
jgi:hypothetical protein